MQKQILDVHSQIPPAWGSHFTLPFYLPGGFDRVFISFAIYAKRMRELFPGVFEINGRLTTRNMVPGIEVYKERLLQISGSEYREWDPFRSKLAAAVKKGMRYFPFRAGSKVLYLGASTGTTVSHLSDIVGEQGEIYAVEISAHVMKGLLKLCEQRKNIFPILADAGKPDSYAEIERADAIYQDVSQPDQADILLKNARRFLSPGSYACIAIKSQSIDVTKRPKEVFQATLVQLETHFKVLETYPLEPFDKDHLFAVLEKRDI